LISLHSIWQAGKIAAAAQLGRYLVARHIWAENEPLLRESLGIRERASADD
jgi:hypothetical protein